MSNEKLIPIKWWEMFKPTPGFQCGEGLSNRLEIEREALPIIFIPGTMASSLRIKGGEKVWVADDMMLMLRKHGLVNVEAADRKALLVGASFKSDYLEVITDDPEHNKKFAHAQDTDRADRGWGGVSWSSYGPFIEALQQHDYTSAWDEPMRHCFEHPVHVFGYNWTASNDDSGKKLAAYIDEVIQKYKAMGRICTHVILITHSMGGLVARSACVLHGAESKVLGIVHGVQPARGAPAAYWRMKGGFDRPSDAPQGEGGLWSFLSNPIKTIKRKPLGTVTSWVLGTDGEEVTALLGNMPGGLELLPNQNYTDNTGSKAWLKFPAADGLSVVELPKSDPYAEIYLEQNAFYRLVNPAWLEPGDKVASTMTDEKDGWSNFKKYLSVAKNFHLKLQDKIHPVTYQFYSEGLNTADRVVYSRHAHDWKTKAARLLKIIKADLPGDLAKSALTAPLLGFNPVSFVIKQVGVAVVKDTDFMTNRGGFRCYVNDAGQDIPTNNDEALFVMQMEMPENNPVMLDGLQKGSGGDGTVPVSSGATLRALDTADVTKDDESYLVRDHEPIFKTKTAWNIVINAIENIALHKIREKT
jgi:pimeloyl-ACP methyl ester carboxylesterase